ncbi:MAG: efflux RND transporter periplasmic adaptor subunit [Burkholderiaceae bacterium]|nr:efflux RND transporter periplasmic adaptor subunit [Burkholderiaceae bacterium]
MPAPAWMNRRNLVLATIAAMLTLGLAWGFREPAARVDASEVRRAPLRASFEEEGRTRVKDRYEFSAPIAGQLERVRLEPGDRVARGERLFSVAPSFAAPLDPREQARAAAMLARAEASLQSARTQMQAAQARSELAASEVERLRPLSKSGHVPAATLDRAVADARAAEALLRSARFSIDVARHERDLARAVLDVRGPNPSLAPIVVDSPLDATVLTRLRQSEGPVQAGAPILTLGDPDSLEVVVDVLSPDAVRLQPGMAVELDRWGGGETLAARVRLVEPSAFTKVSALGVEEQRVWVVVDFAGDPAERRALGDGYRVLARFLLWQDEDVLQAPAAALFRDGQGWAAFVVDAHRARLRRVEIGRRSGLAVEIRGGLQPGERVLLHPSRELRDGGRISLRDE